MRFLLYVLTAALPWWLRRRVLAHVFGYELHPTSYISRLSIVLPSKLLMDKNARIGSFNVCKGMDVVSLGEYASIGRLNWISGFPSGTSRHFSDQKDRRPELMLGEHAAITNRHLIDCTDSVRIGRFATFAGFRSQILTHSIDLNLCRQSSKPVTIGEYCFVGTACVLLGGSALPGYSVLGAGSVLNKPHFETHRLYAGTPAACVKTLPSGMLYHQRSRGFVD
jgi:acetyltransferase-like isoleucine patch superfamily enzyme